VDDNRLEVRVEANNVIGDITVTAYLTDEGLVVDVLQGDECLASGYEFFSEAGLLPPKKLPKLEE